MVLTRQQSETVWVRLCNEILDAGPDTPLRRAFENGDSITSLIAFETSGPQVIQNLVYVNPTEPDQLRQLSPGMKNKATLFQQFLEQLRIDNGNIDLDVAQWNTVTEADFNSFLHNNRVTHNTVALIPGAPPFIAPALPQPATPPDLVREFKKSIKRDDTSYPVFKEQKNWNSWNREMTARARVHDLLDVLTPSFVPDHTVPFAVELFAQKQAFLYNAFLKTIQTDSGRALVRQFEEYHDAQAIYAGLVKFASESTAAVLERDRLIEYVTITKLGLDWRGTNVQFILHWKEQMRLLDDLLPFNEQHPANTRKRMLESAVRDVPELLAIRAMDLNRSAIPGQRPMSYAQYSDVLLSAATELDNRNKIPVKSRRSVHQTVFDPFDNDLFDHDDEAQMLTVWNANSTPMRASVPSELWHKLPVEFQQMIKDHNQTVPSTRNNPNTAKRGAKFQANHTEHTMYPIDDDPDGNLPDDTAVREPESPVDNPILSYVTQRTPIPGIGLKSVFAAAHDRRKGGSYAPVNKDKAPFPPPVPTSTQQSIVVNGVTFLSVDTHNVVYCTSKSATTPNAVASLIDRGANGGLAGSDVRVIETTQRHADVSGINDHTISGLPIVTAAGVVQSHLGPICLIMHQYAYHGKGKTIHSSIQIEQFGNDVNDRSRKFKGGTQSITTIDGYVIPLSIRSGLVYMDMHPPSDTEYDSMPHVALTSDADWDPGITNHELDVESWTDDMIEHDEVPSFNQYGDFLFDDQGYYRPATIVSQHYASLHGHHNSAARGDVFDVTTRIRNLYNSHNVTINPKSPDFALLRPFFAWAPIDTIKRTFDVTTRWARATEQVPFRKHFKSRFPALNIHRRREPVATDTIYSDTPAIDNGATAAQIFVGIETLVTDVYSMKTDSDFVRTLEDNIRRRGAMDKLVSDRAQTEISNKVLDLLRHYAIDDWQSEPYHEHQNHAERRYQLVKKTVNNVLDKTGAPDFTWFLTLRYVCYILNHIAHESLSWQTPLFCLTGHTTDISILTQFTFWEPVYYATASVLKYEGKPNFPSESAEGKGRFVGFGESVGDALTFQVLTDDTQKIIFRSSVRSALDESEQNLRLDTTEGETPKPIREIVKTRVLEEISAGSTSLALIDPDALLNRTYLTEPDESGQRFRAKIVQKIVEQIDANADECKKRDKYTKFIVRVEGSKSDEIVAYNDIVRFLEDNTEEPSEQFWNFKDIVGHEGPLPQNHKSYKGSPYNVMVEWEGGERTYEPLSLIAADCPVICAIYGKRMGLLDQPGWKRFKTIAKREKKMLRMVNQAKLASFHGAPVYHFGFRVPRTPKEALQLDSDNNNTLWTDAMSLEMFQLQEFMTFKDLGRGAPAPNDFKRIRVHFVFAVKHDGRHKARLVADGHLTDTPVDSVYSGVVSLRSLRIVIFLAELNKMELVAADVSNAYLEAETREKVYIIGGLGFGELEGCTLIIFKALYGLKSSGKRWHEKLYDTLRDMSFFPSKADPDVWMREMNGLYEYIAVYVDDLAIASKSPKLIIDALEAAKLKLKGVGPITYHLGCDFDRDPDGTLAIAPRKYLDKMFDAYERLFGNQPHSAVSPLDKNDHPELDDSPELGPKDITVYQSLIGALQWAVSLGRFDVMTAVMTMSGFRVAPRRGHLDRLKRIYGYLKRFKSGAIRVRTGMVDFSHIPEEKHDWMYSVYGNVTELLPTNAPKPLGAPVMSITYEDANLYHDLTNGRAVTGILHLLNGTPIDWFSKRQDTVETATYGAEFVAARIATEQIIDLRTTLRYLGVSIQGPGYMFGDNQSVITSSTLPHSRLSKRHNALSYHRVREAVVARIIMFIHIPGQQNPSDILSKHCGRPQLWPHVSPLFFHMGGTFGEGEEFVEHERIEV